MDCQEKERLFIEYRREVEEWVTMANTLNERANEYNSGVLDRIDELRLRAGHARIQYENHLAEHRCGEARPKQKAHGN